MKERIVIDYKDDCINLHSCRRICKYHKINNRQCNDSCLAYESKEEKKKKIEDLIDDIFGDFPTEFKDGYGYRVFLGDALDCLKEEIQKLFLKQE